MSGAEIPERLRAAIRKEAGQKCGYCKSPQKYIMAMLEVEHIVPRARGGSDNAENLWLSCGLCNRYKGSQIQAADPASEQNVSLFNPRRDKWSEHFRWDAEGTNIVGLTAIGRATVMALQLNNEIAVEVRRNWVLAGWHPPVD